LCILAYGQDIRVLYYTYCHNEDFSHCDSFHYVATVTKSRWVGREEENNIILEENIQVRCLSRNIVARGSSIWKLI